jgi:2-polyprenyl-3-methyl-5-hydroxy-6-metoxy-1,4-benzoquinol methylase
MNNLANCRIDALHGPLSATCPICAGRSKWLFKKFACEYYGCEKCDFEFIWPRPLESELAATYQEDGNAYWSDDRMIRFAYSPTKNRREIALLTRFVSSGSLLDLGCSTGSFVKSARDIGFNAEGIDIAESSVRVGQRRGLPLRAGDVLSMDIPETYDVVTMWATLEHLPDPVCHLRRAHSLLKSNGLLFVSVPNHAGLTQRILGKRNRYVGSEHLNYFFPKVLKKTLSDSGFVVSAMTTYGFNPLIFLKDAVNGNIVEVGCGEMAKDSALTLRAKESWVGRLQSSMEHLLNIFSLGDVVAMVGRKAL